MRNLETFRWLLLSACAALLIWAGLNLWHLKHMELFLLLFSLGCTCLVLAFRKMRTRK